MLRNTLWNLFGFGLPLFVALWAVPNLLIGYGEERFGLIAIIWALIGYFSIFDLGLGRALTQLVSRKIGEGRDEELPDLVRTAMVLIGALGIIACLVGAGASSWFIKDILAVTPELITEGVYAMRIMSVALPFVVISAALVGLLEAYGKFKSITFVRIFMGVGNFVGPVVTLQYSNSLIEATVVLVMVRLVTAVLYFYQCRKAGAFGKARGCYKNTYVRLLFQFGAWLTLSNVLSPIMVQLDKVVIGSVVSVASLPYYAVPADIINRLSFIPSSIVGVLFPLFSKKWAENKESGESVFDVACELLPYILLPISVVLSMFARPAIALWMGEIFSERSTSVVQCMCVGFFVNGMARLPNALLQSVGRPDVTAKLHLVEFPIYALILYFLLNSMGVFGAALAWTIRMGFDAAFHFFAASYVSDAIRQRSIKSMIEIVIGAVSIAIVPLLDSLFYVIFVVVLSLSYLLFRMPRVMVVR